MYVLLQIHLSHKDKKQKLLNYLTFKLAPLFLGNRLILQLPQS